MKNLIKMKKFFYTLSLLVCMLGVSQFTWAGDNYYATLSARTGNSMAVGKVYVTGDDAGASRVSTDTGSSSDENGSVNMTATATVQDERYAFYKWEFLSASATSKTSSSAYTKADIENNENVSNSTITLSLCTPKGSKNNADNASKLTIRAIFYRPNGTNVDKLTFLETEHGKYSVSSVVKNGITQTEYSYADIRDTKKEVENIVAGMPIDCKAVPDDGYIFYSYYTLDAYGNKAYVGDLLVPDQVILIEDDVVKLGAEFTDNAFRIGNTFVKTLADALQVVRTSADKTIQVVRSHTVEAGYYTIPNDVTLLLPMDVDQTEPVGMKVKRLSVGTNPTGEYKKLTLGNGVKLDVFGTIECSAKQIAANPNNTGKGGNPGGGEYGHLSLSQGSSIILNSGAEMRAWGYVTGEGEIDVRRGAVVREMFQMYDWKGGTCTSNMTDSPYKDNYKIFPISAYFIQNVEVKTTYRPGSKLLGLTSIFVPSVEMLANADNIGIIGVEYSDGTKDDALFLMNDTEDSEDTYVCKYYDVESDRQVYEINNSARIGNLHFDVYGYQLFSEDYVLPLTSNMTIRLKSGKMNITQDTELLPGMILEVYKKSTAVIDAGKTLYLYDADDWGKYITSKQYAHRIAYRPGVMPTEATRSISTAAALGDAQINVRGTFEVQGSVYTTTGGANIFSSNEDAGTFIIKTDVPSNETTKTLHQLVGTETSAYVAKNDKGRQSQTCYPAILRNTDALHPTTTTAGTLAGKSYCYMNDKWTMLTVDPDSSAFVYDNYDTYYAKPGEYVAINCTLADKEFVKEENGRKIYNYKGNEDHTYSDAAGTGRFFILVENQWWEVENVENLYHCIHPQNDTYYFWEEGNECWEEKRFMIKWLDWDGSAIKDENDEDVFYMLPYGATPKFLGTNPTRSADVDFTYNFTGWSPAFSSVKGDQTYTAIYRKDTVKYEITFKYQEGIKQGSIISRQFLPRDSMPLVPTLYPIAGYESYSWSPSVGVVTGNQIYEAQWVETAPTTFSVKFNNYDGNVLKKSDGVSDAVYIVDADASPVYDGETPVKTGTNEYTYTFIGWKGPKGFTPKENALPGADADATYTAQFKAEEKTFAIRFFDEGTTNTTKSDENALSKQNLTYGATPTPPAVSKSATGHTYIPEWVDMSSLTFDGEGNITTDEEDWVKSVSTVTKAADYVVVYRDEINRYTVSASSSIAAGCVISGAGTYDYGTEVELTVTPNPGYRFLRWNDNNTDNPRRFTLESNVSLTAVVEQYISDVVMDENAQVTYSKPNTPIHNLYISSDGTNSSYLNGAENLVLSEVDAVQGQAYFDLTLNTWSRHWNAFAVPFEVDLKNTSIVEVKTKGGVATNRTLRYGRDYDIVYYKESVRATSGPSYNCWDYVDSKNKVLTPGEAYLIAFTSHVGTIRFTGEQDGEHHIKLGTGVEVSYTTPADPKDGGWNGIGNPRTYHALLNAGVTECQIHNGDTIGSDSYMPYVMSDKKFVVGKAAFVKVGATPSVVVERATNQSAITPKAAPRRAKTITTGGDRYTVEIMPENGKIADRLFLLVDEEKPDEYTDGKDLPKAGVGSARAQMWVNRYNAKLCKNTVAPIDNQADYPLGIYAPKTGEYTIYIATKTEGAEAMYLTLDGSAIWNLSEGAYTISLERGTTYHYGLRISAKSPQVATGVDEAVVDAHGKTKKVLINDHVYIIRENNVYSIDGQIVK